MTKAVEDQLGWVRISQEYFDELLEAARKLDRLERAGVDNWEGYDYAMSEDAEIQ